MEFRISQIQELAPIADIILSKVDSLENKIVVFEGEMGAGKTTLIKVLAKRLSIQDEVSSPTFSIVNEYHTFQSEIVYHFDLYRLESQEELYDIGAEEYFWSGKICLIEWPEIAVEFLPTPRIVVKLLVDSDTQTRIITVDEW